MNFAFGGSRTTGPQTPGPNTAQQISAFLQNGGRFGANDIATLWAGGNNLLQALPAAAGDPANAVATMTGVANAAAADVAAQTATLAGANARTIVVLNLPSFATVPNFAGTPVAPLAGISTTAFNAALAANLAATAAANPNANIISVDVAPLITAVQANPAAFGFANATQACLSTPACAADPAAWNRYVFWDGVHPTAAGHAMIAAAVAEHLTAPSRAALVTSTLATTALAARRTATLDAFGALHQFAPEPGQWRAFAFATGESGQNAGTAANGLMIAAGSRDTRLSSYRLGGLRAGGLFNAGNGWTFGVMASATTGSIDGRGKFSADVTSVSADALVNWRKGGAFVNLGLGLGVERYGNFAWNTVGPWRIRAGAPGALRAPERRPGTISNSAGPLSPRPCAAHSPRRGRTPSTNRASSRL